MTTALIPAAPSLPVTVIEQLHSEAMLSTWVRRYWEEEVCGSPQSTMNAKRADLQLFFTYFAQLQSEAFVLEAPAAGCAPPPIVDTGRVGLT